MYTELETNLCPILKHGVENEVVLEKHAGYKMFIIFDCLLFSADIMGRGVSPAPHEVSYMGCETAVITNISRWGEILRCSKV